MSNIIIKILEIVRLKENLIRNVLELSTNVGDIVLRLAVILYLEAFPPKQLDESPYFWWVFLVLKVDVCCRLCLCSYYIFKFWLYIFSLHKF